MKHFKIQFEVHNAAGECLCRAVFTKPAETSIEATIEAIADLHRLGVVRKGETLSVTTEAAEPSVDMMRWAEAHGYNSETIWRN